MLISQAALAQFHQFGNENVACQLPSVPTQEFNNFNNLLDLFETRVKTYHYSKSNQTVYVPGKNRKYYALVKRTEEVNITGNRRETGK